MPYIIYPLSDANNRTLFFTLNSLLLVHHVVVHNAQTTVGHGKKMLHTLLVKHYNDLLESSERVKNKVSYFYVGNIFVNIFAEISGNKFQIFM